MSDLTDGASLLAVQEERYQRVDVDVEAGGAETNPYAQLTLEGVGLAPNESSEVYLRLPPGEAEAIAHDLNEAAAAAQEEAAGKRTETSGRPPRGGS